MTGSRRGQRGQAIVLIALAMVALLAIVALAIDGGRAYYDRRMLQGAADAAALAAADSNATGADVPSALKIGGDIFAENVRQGPTSGSLSGQAMTFGWPGYALQISHEQVGGSWVFKAVAHHDLGLTMMQVVGIGPTIPVRADAWASAGGTGGRSAVLALSQDGCPGANGSAISIGGSTVVTIDGDVQSNGSITVNPNAGVTIQDGSVGYNCPPAPKNLQATQTGLAPDPAYAPADLSHYSAPQLTPADAVLLSPGTYSSDPKLNSHNCYFLSAGIYSWLGGYTNNGGVVSNRLTPPDANQIWKDGGASCVGRVDLKAVDGGAATLPAADTWGVEVTTLRSDSFWTAGGQPVSVTRESAPSSCASTQLKTGQDLQVGISNVPGAMAYSIYLSRGGCSGPFGLMKTLPTSTATWPQLNTSGSSCPELPGTWPLAGAPGQSAGKCQLGYVISPRLFQSGYTPATGLTCASLPRDPWNTGSLGCSPASATRDEANQDYCVAADGSPAACPAKASPGAVQYKLAGGSCIQLNGGGATVIFGGMQFANIVVYASGACNDVINGGAGTEMIGLVYLPGRDLTITGGSGTLIQGSLVVDTLSLSGGSGIRIQYDLRHLPPPPGAKLVR